MSRDNEKSGLAWALLGVASFSLTFPALRFALQGLPPTFVGTGRAVVAALCASVLLLATRQRLPQRRHWPALARVAIGVVAGFSWLSAEALVHLSAVQAGVMAALLPLVTAAAGAWRAGERPPRAFWIAAVLGSLGVIAYAAGRGGTLLGTGDWTLLAAVFFAAFGYAEGGRLARELGGWQVISWALVFAAPLLLIPAVLNWPRHAAPWSAWTGFLYLALVSQWLGFFAWYRGMALAGVARTSQVQLLQVFFTLMAAWALLGEPVAWSTWLFALWVVAAVAVGRSVAGRRAPAGEPRSGA
ncbi:MAG: DMT family transporter [Acidihalobacter sp.]|uniref:DMT family transporter n=1 Tax=Acidihalobacter sp. TaxID=1872108 RepID=UPI00307DC892